MLGLSGFELYSRWVPLIRLNFFAFDKFTLQNLANKSGGV